MEALVQSQIRLECARRGWKIWRNNVGVLLDATGRPIRYGLANDTSALNKVLKSADLIGWDDEGRFVSIECKGPGGRVHPGQEAWRELVASMGGYAIIARGIEDL